MDLSRYTELAQQAMVAAQQIAVERSHGTLTPLHLLHGALQQTQGIPRILLKELGAPLGEVDAAIDAALQKQPTVSGGQLSADRSLQLVLAEAQKQMKALGDEYVSLEHLLLALALTDGNAKELLQKFNVNAAALLATLKRIRGSSRVTDQNPEAKLQALAKYTVDFTALARDGKLDPVIGRDEEIRRTMQILSRRTKNNPVLVGEPGTGKTAIVEGLAQRIVQGDVPDSLRNKRLLNQKLSHTDDIIQMQHRHRKIERLIGHHRKKTV